jgi:hypothetical protein
MYGDSLLLPLGFSDLHSMDPLVVICVLAIRLGIDLVEEPDILEFRGANLGGGRGLVEEGGQGGLPIILYKKDQVRVHVSFRVLVD